jgi:DNA-binding MarR family transcriptional regulator
MSAGSTEGIQTGWLHTTPLLGRSVLSILPGLVMNREDNKMAVSMLIDQQLAFIAKFRALFRLMASDEDTNPFGQNQIPVQRLELLLAIKQHPGKSQAELARQLKLSDAAAGRHVKDLEQKFGLLRVKREFSGEQRTACYLNARGEEVVSELLSVFFPRPRG